MEAWVQASVQWLLAMLALPEVGLSAIFVISLVSATLLPLGSEPAVFAFVKVAPDMFWPAVAVATLGNTLGGIVSYAMGLGAKKAYRRWQREHGLRARRARGATFGSPRELARKRGAAARFTEGDAAARGRLGGRWHVQVHYWVNRLGPLALLFSWLPAVGDPLCAVAGWLRLSFWPCVLWMAVGKAARYVVFTAVLMRYLPFPPGA